MSEKNSRARISQLFYIHCGFYEEEISERIYEFNVNIPVVAESLEAAKAKGRLDTIFQKKKTHIDGIRELNTVSGFEVKVIQNGAPSNTTKIAAQLHRDFWEKL